MSYSVTVAHRLELSEAEATRICINVLEQKIIQGRWIRENKIVEEHVTSHRFDVEVGDVTDPKFTDVVAAIRVKSKLQLKTDHDY